MTYTLYRPKTHTAWLAPLIDLIRDYYTGTAPRKAVSIDAALREANANMRPGDVAVILPADRIPRRYLKHAFGFAKLVGQRSADGLTRYEPVISFQKKPGPIWTVGGVA